MQRLPRFSKICELFTDLVQFLLVFLLKFLKIWCLADKIGLCKAGFRMMRSPCQIINKYRFESLQMNVKTYQYLTQLNVIISFTFILVCQFFASPDTILPHLKGYQLKITIIEMLLVIQNQKLHFCFKRKVLLSWIYLGKKHYERTMTRRKLISFDCYD